MPIKKVALISSSSKIGGTELSSMRLGRILNENEYEPIIIAPEFKMKDELSKYYIKFETCKFADRNPLGLILGIKRLREIFNSECFDIIHCQDAYSAIVAYYANRSTKSNIPIIWHLRGISTKSYYLMTKLQFMFSVVIANSKSERNKLIEHGFNPDKIFVIYNAIERDVSSKSKEEVRKELKIKNDDFLIGSVGRLDDSMKGNLFLLKTFEHLLDSIPNGHLIFIGDGKDRNILEEYTKDHNLTEKVTFTGYRRDTADLFKAMDVFAFPSWWEPFGNVAVEAMFEKTPVVASYVGGIPEIITNMDNGLLVTSGVEKEWIDAFIYIFENKDKVNSMVSIAQKQALDKYNFSRLFKELSMVYENLCKKE